MEVSEETPQGEKARAHVGKMSSREKGKGISKARTWGPERDWKSEGITQRQMC